MAVAVAQLAEHANRAESPTFTGMTFDALSISWLKRYYHPFSTELAQKRS